MGISHLITTGNKKESRESVKPENGIKMAIVMIFSFLFILIQRLTEYCLQRKVPAVPGIRVPTP
jgi:hypothetical protein